MHLLLVHTASSSFGPMLTPLVANKYLNSTFLILADRHSTVMRAEQVPREPPLASTDDESRLEALESSMRAKKGAKVASAAASSSRQSAGPDSRFAEWKEGQLFPEGWDQMNPLEKMNELYLGQRGFLFWSTKLATGGVVVLGVAWVLFRIVGPALGLYQLADDINTPSF
jgi:hypothetical protein